MTTVLEGYVRKGWKVFLGGEKVGEVADVGHDEIAIRRGTFLRREVRVPSDAVIAAEDGVVDLRPDARTRELLGLD